VGKREMSQEDQLSMREALEEVKEAFPNTLAGFLLFAQTVINTLIKGNPNLNRVQADICKWLFSGGLYRMVQAQRGQAKTTFTAIYAVFRLIHNPRLRVVIFSAGGGMSKKIASFVIQMLDALDFLWMLRADSSAGDRSSVEGYDVHWVFRGTSAQPSVACMGVEASVAGNRADLLIADDIESMKNSSTVGAREKLEDLTKEFEAICTDGDIIYLGTPQSVESIYNNLGARGYAIRVWPGRYPTEKEEETYGDLLAPIIKNDLILDQSLRNGGGLNGDMGKPTCPEMFPELLLCTKELSMGKAKFQLQYMLNTSLSDEERYPLKLKNLIVADFNVEQGPVLPVWSNDPRNLYQSIAFGAKFKTYRAVNHDYELRPFEQTIMYIDPAGGGKNADEMGYAVIKLIGAYVYIAAIGGVPGGYEEDKLVRLVKVAKEYNAKTVVVEKNYGNGAHANMLKPLFAKNDHPVIMEEAWETGQKELRIIDVIEPLLTSHRLIISPSVLEQDAASVSLYPTNTQLTYRLIHQMKMITRDKGCLRHDDRLDALAGAIRFVIERLDFDTQVMIEAKRRSEEIQKINAWKDPVSRRKWLGVDYKPAGAMGGRNSLSGKRPVGVKRRNRFG